MENEKLRIARMLDDLLYDYDPYEYRNNETGPENGRKEGIDAALKDIEGTIEALREMFMQEEEDNAEYLEKLEEIEREYNALCKF